MDNDLNLIVTIKGHHVNKLLKLCLAKNLSPDELLIRAFQQEYMKYREEDNGDKKHSDTK